MAFSETYNKTAEELRDRLIKTYDEWVLPEFGREVLFPSDIFSDLNPKFRNLVCEIEDKYNYGMSEFQCSWAVMSFYNTVKCFEKEGKLEELKNLIN